MAEFSTGIDERHLESELVLPVQWFAGLKGQNQTPERRLLLAVMEDTITIYLGRKITSVGTNHCSPESKTARQLRAAAEAEIWLFEDGGQGPFSFTAICEVFDVEPSWLRKGLRAWKAKQEANALPLFPFRHSHSQAGQANARPRVKRERERAA